MLFAAGSVHDISVRAFKLCGLTWGGDHLWFSEAATNQIMAIDPHTGEVTRRIPCPGIRTDLTTMGGNLVQVVGPGTDLRLMDAESGAVVGELANPRPGHTLCGLEATRGGVWMGYEDLRVLDLRNGEDLSLIETVPVTHKVSGLTVSDRFVLYADYACAYINVVDRVQRREVASIWVDGNPTGITWDGSQIWYCDNKTLQLRAIEVPGIIAG